MTLRKLREIEDYVKKAMKKSNDPQHNYDHVDSVRKNALKIAAILNLKDIDLNLLQAVCLLHDVPIALFKHGPFIKHYFERSAIKKYLPGILNKLEIEKDEEKIIYNAIQKHTFSIPYGMLNKKGDLYARIMQDADTLEFLNPGRESSFLKQRNNYYLYYFLSFISGKYLKYARKNLGKFLNFPELAKYNRFD